MAIHAQHPGNIGGDQRRYLCQHARNIAQLPDARFGQFRTARGEKHLTLEDKAVPHNAHFRPFAQNITQPAKEITAIALQFLNPRRECRIQALADSIIVNLRLRAVLGVFNPRTDMSGAPAVFSVTPHWAQ